MHVGYITYIGRDKTGYEKHILTPLGLSTIAPIAEARRAKIPQNENRMGERDKIKIKAALFDDIVAMLMTPEVGFKTVFSQMDGELDSIEVALANWLCKSSDLQTSARRRRNMLKPDLEEISTRALKGLSGSSKNRVAVCELLEYIEKLQRILELKKLQSPRIEEHY